MAKRDSSDSKADAEAVSSVVTSDAAPLPAAIVAAKAGPTEPPADIDPMRWERRAIFLGALVVGWLFIGWQNRFYLSAPTIVVGLGYLAVLSTIYALWRTGVTAVADDIEDDGADSTWGRPTGRRGELEREKRTLLKAIKEAEFDREMGKLSAKDADEMIAVYRLRAIETIKELDYIALGSVGTVREQIEREVKARIELDKRMGGKRAEAGARAFGDAPAQAVGPPMPSTLAVVVVVLVLATMGNLVTSSFIAAGFYAVMLIGVVLGNNGVRVFLRGFAVVAIAALLVLTGPNIGRLTPLALGVIVVSITIWIGVIVVLGLPEVRDWMFRKSFKLDGTEGAASYANPSGHDSTVAATSDERAAPVPTDHDSTVEASEAKAAEQQ